MTATDILIAIFLATLILIVLLSALGPGRGPSYRPLSGDDLIPPGNETGDDSD